MVATEDKYTEKDKDLQSLVEYCFNNCQTYFKDRQRNFERFEGRRAKREARQVTHDHEYISTAASDMIEQKAAFTTEAVTNFGERMFSVGTYNNLEAARDAKAASELLNYYVSNIPLTEMSYMLHKNIFLYGTGVVEVYHKRTTRKEAIKNDGKIRLKVSDSGEFQSIAASDFEDVDDFKQPVFRQIDLNNFWYDPDILEWDINTARWICTRELMTAKSVRRNKERFGLKNLDRALKTTIPKRTTPQTQESGGGLRKRDAEYNIERIIERNGRNSATKENPIVEVIRIFRPGTVQFMINGVICSDEQVIYPGIIYPFVIFRNQPQEGEFLGRADLELVKNNIEFYEELINLIHDKRLMNLKPVIFADAFAMDTEQLEKYKKAKAGDVITVDGFTSDLIKEIAQTPPDPAATEFANGFLAEAKKSLAINPMMESENPGSGIRTEGSLQMFQRLGSTRMQTQLNIIVFGWEQVGKLMLKMSKIFADKELFISIAGPLGDAVEGFIDPRNVDINTKFKIKLGAIADPKRDTRIAQMMKYVEMCAKYDTLGLFHVEQALAETGEYIDFFHDPVGLWETDPEAINARRILAAEAAGKPKPSPVTGFPSMSEAQAMQPAQPAQPAEGQVQAQQTQASDLPTVNEGVPVAA